PQKKILAHVIGPVKSIIDLTCPARRIVGRTLDQERSMARYRGTTEGTATIVGRLLRLIAAGQETSASLSEQLDVSPRQVNRYVLQLIEAGWQIERRGVPTLGDYWFELVAPKIVPAKRPESRKLKLKRS